MAPSAAPRRQQRELADRLYEHRLEVLKITSKKAAAEKCGGMSEATYSAAEDPAGTTRTSDKSLEKIADGFGLDLLKLRGWRDGVDSSDHSTRSSVERAVDAASKRLLALPVMGVRQAVISLINELYDALGPKD